MCVDSGVFFFSSRRRDTGCALVTGVQTCALPIDSAGRERVGSVLRGLSSRAGAEPNEEDDRPYETVILILQDSVASELEDAFDRIDVVVKDGTKDRKSVV